MSKTPMDRAFDVAFTPTSCVYAKNCAVPAKKAREEVWERMCPSCRELKEKWYCGAVFGKATFSPGLHPCAFAACPLLKEE